MDSDKHNNFTSFSRIKQNTQKRANWDKYKSESQRHDTPLSTDSEQSDSDTPTPIPTPKHKPKPKNPAKKAKAKPIPKKIKHTVSDSDSDNDIPLKPKAKNTKSAAKKALNSSKKKKRRKVQSEKVGLTSSKKKKGTKSKEKAIKKRKKVAAQTESAKKEKKSNKKDKKKLAVSTPPVSRAKSSQNFRRKKKKKKKAVTMTESEMKHNVSKDMLFGSDDEKKELAIGNNEDLAKYALDSKTRDLIKANKNATYGGFRVKINYRYRIDDNRIGLCRFIGIPLFAKTSEEWIGLVIKYNGEGEHDGSMQNKSYFRCRDGKGLFVRPFRIIEDLGINTIQLTQTQIKGSEEMKQLIKDIKSGKKDLHQKKSVKEVVKPKAKPRPKINARVKKKRTIKQRSKTVTNLDDKGKWKPPTWMNEIDQDHGYDFLASKPFYSKEHLLKYKYKAKPVSVTSSTAKNNY